MKGKGFSIRQRSIGAQVQAAADQCMGARAAVVDPWRGAVRGGGPHRRNDGRPGAARHSRPGLARRGIVGRHPPGSTLRAPHRTVRSTRPFTSHWALRFSTTTRPGLSVVGPCLMANGDGTYGVSRGFATAGLGRFATADEAVALAVLHLPSGLGPVTLGA
ncbi:DUF6193 family natural product biosynthesis protein [Streptomyces sp. NPDC045431]|uniref:DUF6193 family natural product biosynthesis protein n=1 Tax=Streptomyces sp. NPDC045431 TaxID=3155613 RepID=UPI0033D62D69